MTPTTPHAGGFFSGIVSSPRAQRRLLWISAAVFVAGAIAFISVFVLRGTGNAFNSPISNQPAQVAKPEVPAPPSKAAFAVARKFLQTAVLRKNLDSSYTLVHPDMKGALTRKQWGTGNIPVIGYPANNTATASFVVDYSYKTSMLLEVDLVAKPGSGVRPHLDFYLGLKRAGDKPTGRWLVSYWEPNWRPPLPNGP